MRPIRQALQVDILGDGHAMHVYLQDLHPSGAIRDTYLYLSIESARPPESRIDCLFPVCGSNHHNLTAFLQAVHHGQELGHNPPLHLASDIPAPRGDGVYLVDKNDGRCCLLCILEDLSQSLLAFAIIL
ncbi:Uncharacterised protein [uncultured archaeon]|nr:Uncharacterised protein [uncultured archaeon]